MSDQAEINYQLLPDQSQTSDEDHLTPNPEITHQPPLHGVDLIDKVQFSPETNQNPNRTEDQDRHRIVLRCRKNYIKSRQGIFRIIQIVLSFAALVCIASAGSEVGSFLYLPLAWHHRVFVFVTVFGLLSNITLFIVHATALVKSVPCSLLTIEMVTDCFGAFLFLFGTSLVASAAEYYDKTDEKVKADTKHKLIAAIVLGYVLMGISFLSTILFYRVWRHQRKGALYTAQRKTSQQEALVT